MKSRERVLAVFKHQEPDIVPIWCGASTAFWEKATSKLNLDDEGLRRRFGDDFRRVFAQYCGPQYDLEHQDATQRTVFGIERHGIGYDHPFGHPLADATLEEVYDYAWPDAQWIDISGVRTQAEQYRGEYAILGGDWSPFQHDAIDLLGMENLLVKAYEEPEIVKEVLQHIVDYYTAVDEFIFEAASDVLDIFFFGNDFASQKGPLIGPSFF